MHAAIDTRARRVDHNVYLAATRSIRHLAHIVEMPASLNTAILFGLIGCGLMACVIGALMYDAGRLFSAS